MKKLLKKRDEKILWSFKIRKEKDPRVKKAKYIEYFKKMTLMAMNVQSQTNISVALLT